VVLLGWINEALEARFGPGFVAQPIKKKPAMIKKSHLFFIIFKDTL